VIYRYGKCTRVALLPNADGAIAECGGRIELSFGSHELPSSSRQQPCTRFGVCSGPQSVLDPSNIRPVLITLGIACVLGALLYFTNNIAVSEAMERRRLMYSRTGSFVPSVCLPDAPKDVRHRAVDGRPPAESAITNGSSTDGGEPARYDLVKDICRC
jgi:hypothetical protein